MMWIIASTIAWFLDWVTTDVAIKMGAMEGNPLAAYFHGYLGIHGYALVLLPLLVGRGYLAQIQGTTPLARSVRVSCRIFIGFHYLVLVNNFYVIATL